ncbi:hypothetical protein ABKN59_007078 [Abortiporus biennis]
MPRNSRFPLQPSYAEKKKPKVSAVDKQIPTASKHTHLSKTSSEVASSSSGAYVVPNKAGGSQPGLPSNSTHQFKIKTGSTRSKKRSTGKISMPVVRDSSGASVLEMSSQKGHLMVNFVNTKTDHHFELHELAFTRFHHC